MNEYIPHQPAPERYCETRWSIMVVRPESPRTIAGEAQRVGITPPHFRTRAVYRICTGFRGDEQVYAPDLYVYADGCFTPTTDWYAAESAAGRYPLVESVITKRANDAS
jgi:hypothetical protein